MRRSITTRVGVGITLVGIAIVAAIAVLAMAIGELRDRGASAREAERTLSIVSQAQGLIVDAETAMRGFVIRPRA